MAAVIRSTVCGVLVEVYESPGVTLHTVEVPMLQYLGRRSEGGCQISAESITIPVDEVIHVSFRLR